MAFAVHGTDGDHSRTVAGKADAPSRGAVLQSAAECEAVEWSALTASQAHAHPITVIRLGLETGYGGTGNAVGRDRRPAHLHSGFHIVDVQFVSGARLPAHVHRDLVVAPRGQEIVR